MAYKCIILIALIGFIAATPIEYHHESGHHFIEDHHEHHHEAPQPYDFSYGVHDEHTGDVKDQHESSDGHNVHGSYSLIDADGYKRTVTYSADPHKGFEAEVHRVPLGHGHGHGGHIVADHHSFDGHHF